MKNLIGPVRKNKRAARAARTYEQVCTVCAKQQRKITTLIIKITISSIVIGLRYSYFPLIHVPSCYRTVCYRTVQQTNHIQSCSLNQSITFKVVV